MPAGCPPVTGPGLTQVRVRAAVPSSRHLQPAPPGRTGGGLAPPAPALRTNKSWQAGTGNRNGQSPQLENWLIPYVKDFIKHYGSGYTPNELLRMELAILDKLHWDLYMGTQLDFLTIFHTVVVLGWPHVVELFPQRNPSLHVASLTRQPQHCMAGHQLPQFKGSTLALAIITLELERLTPDWCTPISDLLKKAQLTIEQLSCCKELVKQQLRSF